MRNIVTTSQSGASLRALMIKERNVELTVRRFSFSILRIRLLKGIVMKLLTRETLSRNTDVLNEDVCLFVCLLLGFIAPIAVVLSGHFQFELFFVPICAFPAMQMFNAFKLHKLDVALNGKITIQTAKLIQIQPRYRNQQDLTLLVFDNNQEIIITKRCKVSYVVGQQYYVIESSREKTKLHYAFPKDEYQLGNDLLEHLANINPKLLGWGYPRVILPRKEFAFKTKINRALIIKTIKEPRQRLHATSFVIAALFLVWGAFFVEDIEPLRAIYAACIAICVSIEIIKRLRVAKKAASIGWISVKKQRLNYVMFVNRPIQSGYLLSFGYDEQIDTFEKRAYKFQPGEEFYIISTEYENQIIKYAFPCFEYKLDKEFAKIYNDCLKDKKKK